MEKAIRKWYEKLGVEGYYRELGAAYENPHFLQIRELLHRNRAKIAFENGLDLCCGSGEVSMVIKEMGYPLPAASDPFTAAAYQANFGATCLPFTFEDIIRGALSEQGPFSSIICSFSMHLCPVKQLFPLVYQLFRRSPQLVILTPHKRPQLERLDGIYLEFTDYVLTERGKKVFLKIYSESWKQ